MKQADYLPIGEFAKLSGVSRKNLIYYDSIDLLKPEKITSKGFRYYHYHQLYTINMIVALKEVKIPLKEIKAYMTEQKTETILAMLSRQKKMANQRSAYFARMEQMLDMQIQSISRTLTDNPYNIEHNTYEDVPLFYDKIPYCRKTFRFSVSLTKFYKYCISRGYEFPYPSGFCMIPNNQKSSIIDQWSLQLYAKVPNSTDVRPKGEYLSIYTTDSFNFDQPYRQLADYAEKHGLTLAKKAYFDFVSNELVAKNFEDFRLKMMIQIDKSAD